MFPATIVYFVLNLVFRLLSMLARLTANCQRYLCPFLGVWAQPLSLPPYVYTNGPSFWLSRCTRVATSLSGSLVSLDHLQVPLLSEYPPNSKNGLKDTQKCFPSLKTKNLNTAEDLELFEWSVFAGTLGRILLIY